MAASTFQVTPYSVSLAAHLLPFDALGLEDLLEVGATGATETGSKLTLWPEMHIEIVDNEPVSVLMIDQLEELWREGVITPSRRARFLTDLRALIDHGLSGAPVAVLLAWNTTTGGSQIGDRITEDYRALWERLGEPVDLPPLSASHVWPFAQAYLAHAGVSASAPSPRRKQLNRELEARASAVLSALQEDSLHRDSGFPARRVLREWRKVAEALVQVP